jgi:hypothetical protein
MRHPNNDVLAHVHVIDDERQHPAHYHLNNQDDKKQYLNFLFHVLVPLAGFGYVMDVRLDISGRFHDGEYRIDGFAPGVTEHRKAYHLSLTIPDMGHLDIPLVEAALSAEGFSHPVLPLEKRIVADDAFAFLRGFRVRSSCPDKSSHPTEKSPTNKQIQDTDSSTVSMVSQVGNDCR